MQRTGTRHHLDDRATATWLLLQKCLWWATAPAIGTYLAAARVPDIRADSRAYHLDGTGEVAGAALGHPQFLALPNDPAASHPDATMIEGPEALRAHLRQRIIHAVGGLLEGLAADARRGRRARWALLADTVAGACLWIGGQLGDEQRAINEGEALLDGTPPLVARANYLPSTSTRDGKISRIRNTCCLAYKLADQGYCSTCSLKGESQPRTPSSHPPRP